MGELVGEGYGDDRDPAEEEGAVDDPARERSEIRGGMQPGQGKNDAPATTGTHRGWGDPQAGEQQPEE